MSKLYQFTLDPYCRRVRLALAEKGLTPQLADERPWAPSQQLLDLNPSGLLPVWADETGQAICGIEAVGEFLEERHPEKSLLPGNAWARAEARRIVAWFDVKFYTEVTEPLLTEKVVKRFMPGSAAPDMARVRLALQNLKPHLDYLALLAEERSWLAGDELSLADLAAAAHLSAIDYLGDINWRENQVARSWYERIKSRPAFRVLLSDTVAAMPPAPHYAELDF
ncbi:glutathione S-transferase family protein [Aestuariivirga litoralis]|uniref:glutathione S-transferase family protein n=1 Tax=Aestuariivirga litoralis TaxID=2650924 RepID=UPI0018C833D9|nr:glutathione S-transferase family protein [Aestuariivirga litoralis]MBG1232939.1 glutathione S-transferase family protein [Aestuariivirga litoralis]